MLQNLLLIGFLALSGCATKVIKPKPEICIYNSKKARFTCYDPKKEVHRVLKYKEANRYVCLSADDFLDSLDFLHGVYKPRPVGRPKKESK